ncbi:hypothetical protein SGGMMB4_04661 [Sodalis glossinidius str. 'morsitans']|uniref:Uncharacterized protein n=1 Tax=Sodalis glossinidius (strain morsitans) TaxID=343509 RepID=A0A193QMS9_SODGM|nr:hypothetical protein [Sodalis glossinidius]CRL46225.1 hypothetical protein SGGMMB4_04661 [Sodalis glossinidius str. 'morsitans']
MYLSQRGISAWDSRLTYPLFAVVQHAGKFYVAKKESSDQSPDTSQNVWMSMAAVLDFRRGV